MSDPLRQVLFEFASRFRTAILRSAPTSPLPTLRDFPRGACGDASLLLAKYLQVNGWGMALYVVGERRGERHAWLQLHGFIVDITADQFDDQHCGTIVTDESAWHSAFNGKIYNTADFCLYAPDTVSRLRRAYEAITSDLFLGC